MNHAVRQDFGDAGIQVDALKNLVQEVRRICNRIASHLRIRSWILPMNIARVLCVRRLHADYHWRGRMFFPHNVANYPNEVALPRVDVKKSLTRTGSSYSFGLEAKIPPLQWEIE